MKKSTIGKLLLGLILVGFIYVQYTVLERVLITPKDLTEVYGTIMNIQNIKIPKKYVGYSYAYALEVKDNLLRFAISDGHEEAFDFIGSNHILGKKIRLFYDKNGFNDDDNLTYHVYYVEINSQEILSFNESKRNSKFGLGIFFLGDLLIIWIIIYSIKGKRVIKRN